eukprot:gene27286-32958_t
MKLLVVLVIAILSSISAFSVVHKAPARRLQTVKQGHAYLLRLCAGKTASSKIRVQLLADVKDVGKKGDILMVNPAVYMNVLQIKRLAKKVSDEELASMQAEQQQKAFAAYTAADTYAKQLKTIALTIAKKIGANNQLFGSVNRKQVLEEIKRLAPTTLIDWSARGLGIEDVYEDVGDGKRGNVVEDIRRGGKYVVRVRVHADVEPVHIPLTIVQQK